ncbi:MAG TPA: rhodanese-like domain-containing protein [Thermoanaerobaculia bacterium]|nr:rhodanese-like domain-containing protein [Thermoanaerobaculia bacterium]
MILLLLLLSTPAPDLIVPPSWVVEHRAIPVDVRPAAAFEAGHLPGAVRVTVAPECVASGVECVQKELGKAGLGGEEAVVVVGEDGAAVGEAFWLLEWVGLKEVRVLDGAISAQGPETGPGRREARAFTAPASESAAADVAWMRSRVGTKGVELLDLRDEGIWMERDYEAPARFAAGHLPHALPFDFRRWLPVDDRWPAAGRVWETLQRLGPREVTKVDPKAEFVLYGEGPADREPGLGYLLLRRAGIPVRVFPGGFREWSRDPADPVVRIVGAPEVDRLLEAENPGLKGDDVARSVVVLDLREPGDFKLGHVPGAYNFPAYTEGTAIEKVVEERWPQARAARTPVVLYCYGRPCIRSRDAAARLARAGFTNLLWLREGMEAWEGAGLPVAGRPHGAAPSGYRFGPYFAGSNFRLTPFMQ